MLALAFVRWLHATWPDDRVEVLAFRPGALRSEAPASVPVVTVLEAEEPWGPDQLAGARGAALRNRLAGLEPVDVNLLVSVAAAQALPLLPASIGPLVTWVVEVGDDLHWARPGGVFDGWDTAWLAGSSASAAALAEVVPGAGRVPVVPEFVDAPPPRSTEQVAARRAAAGVSGARALVLGAGIGTRRKGLDLFLEAAAALADDASVRSVWVGGDRDPLWGPVRDQAARQHLEHLSVLPATDQLDGWMAAADVFLHPAREDAFPLVCLHAALAGTPVVAFADTGVSEMFGADFAGAPYPDVASLTRRVLELVHDPSARSELGRRQHDAVAARNVTALAAPRLREAALGVVGAGTAR